MREEGIYRLLFEASGQGMVLRQGERIVLVNQSFADMVGYTREELLAFTIEEALALIHPEDREMVLARFRAREAGQHEPSQIEYRYIRRHGETGWWSAMVSTVNFGGQPAVLGTYIDISERKQAEEAIRRERQFLADVLNELPVGISLTDEAGTYRVVNDAFHRIYDFEPAEIVGQHYTTIVPPDQVELARAQYAQLLAGDLAIPVERKRQRKDGRIVHIEAANALVEDPDGQKMVITSVRDVTHRREGELALQESLAREKLLGDIIRNASIAIGIGHPDGRISMFNLATTQLTGYSQEELKTLDWHVELTPPEWYDVEGAKLAELHRTRRPVRYEKEYRRKDGSRVPIELVVHPQFGPNGEICAYEAFVTDISERKQAEKALGVVNAELQARNEDLHAFSHTVAHDLVSPISVIVGFAEILRVDYLTLTDKERRKYLDLIAENGHRMRRIVDELLLLASVHDRQTMETEPLDMTPILAEVQIRLREVFAAHDSQFVVPAAFPIAMGYGPWVEQVWVNYISNALKYGGDPPIVELGAEPLNSGHIRFWVKDNGKGLTAAEKERVFQPYERLQQQRVQGYGLGLSIVRRIIEKLGGEVGVDSKLGEGSTFFFTLPTPESSQGA